MWNLLFIKLILEYLKAVRHTLYQKYCSFFDSSTNRNDHWKTVVTIYGIQKNNLFKLLAFRTANNERGRWFNWIWADSYELRRIWPRLNTFSSIWPKILKERSNLDKNTGIIRQFSIFWQIFSLYCPKDYRPVMQTNLVILA